MRTMVERKDPYRLCAIFTYGVCPYVKSLRRNAQRFAKEGATHCESRAKSAEADLN